MNTELTLCLWTSASYCDACSLPHSHTVDESGGLPPLGCPQADWGQLPCRCACAPLATSSPRSQGHNFSIASLQGAFGRAALGITSLVTYIGLGLGVLGSGLALPFGLYILIVQRSPEAVLQDSVTAPSSSRQVRRFC